MSDTVLPPESKGKAYALLIGIEKYQETKLEDVTYAENDASAIHDALVAVGYDTADILLISSNDATKTNIEYEARMLAKTVNQDDSVFFFFAGHGYTIGGKNFLLARDTRRDDVEHTSVSLAYIFELFDKSQSRRVMFFLDCCHSGMHLVDGSRGFLETLSKEELKEHFANSAFRVVFSSCDKDQKSWPSYQFKHGYWTFHVLKALRGEEPRILDDSGRLRSAELQDYLAVEVPKQIALQRTERRLQTPKMFGDSSGTFVVADLSALLAKRQAEEEAQSIELKHTSLRGVKEGAVKNLSGFEKSRGHTPPKFYSDKTQSWVADLAESDIKKEMESYHTSIQAKRLYKRKELIYDEPTEGSAAIRTPDFEFTITYSQKADNPAEYRVIRELTRLDKPSLLAEDWFNNLFRRDFDEAVLEFTDSIDVADLIDKIEDAGNIDVDYDANSTYCTITLGGFDGEITITSDSLTYRFNNAETPGEMVLQLEHAHALLLQESELRKSLPL